MGWLEWLGIAIGITEAEEAKETAEEAREAAEEAREAAEEAMNEARAAREDHDDDEETWRRAGLDPDMDRPTGSQSLASRLTKGHKKAL
jgi:hypothetical protein